MAPGPADREAIDGIALLGDPDRIEPPAAERRCDCAGLVDRGRGPDELRSLGDDPADAVEAARLLVGGAREQDVPAQSRDRVGGGVAADRAGLRREHPDDGQLHREEVLHVDRATSPDVGVGDVPIEGPVGPQVGGRRDDVEMAEEEERVAAGAVATQPRDHRTTAGHQLEDFGLESGIGEGPGDPARGAGLAVRGIERRRVDRWDPDQRPECLDELSTRRFEDAVAERGRGQGRAGRHDQSGLPTRALRPASWASTPSTNPARTITITMIRRIRT